MMMPQAWTIPTPTRQKTSRQNIFFKTNKKTGKNLDDAATGVDHPDAHKTVLEHDPL
jgi:hypothetical protein